MTAKKSIYLLNKDQYDGSSYYVKSLLNKDYFFLVLAQAE